MSNTKNQIIEFAPFTLAEGVNESTLLAASDALQAEFLARQKGFIKRDLLKTEEGKWADVLYWDSRESVEQAMQEAATHPAALSYFQLMATADHDNPVAGMMLLHVARSYAD
jgi:heme-degrading monooxygenase HmoA